MVITQIKARQILNSRGNPTVEVDVYLQDGMYGRASVPSGASTGSHEAVELLDGGDAFHGRGVLKAIENIHTTISANCINKDLDQRSLDNLLLELDDTHNKANLGANAILGVSMAFAHASANSQKRPLYEFFSDLVPETPNKLPTPLMNIINGGRHSNNGLAIQEFMIVPHGASNFSESLRYGSEVFHTLKEILSNHGISTAVGDEGGFAPQLSKNSEALDYIVEAIQKSGYTPGEDISIALDPAATEFCRGAMYTLDAEKTTLDANGLTDYYIDLMNRFPIISIEDPLSEDDWDGWAELMQRVQNVQIVGDDLFVTNPTRVENGIRLHAANAVLIKPNQIGSVSETVDTINLARTSSLGTVLSHRSGETEDVTIAHMAVGFATGQIKTGSLSRSERLAKYNELLRIEENDPTIEFAGKSSFIL